MSEEFRASGYLDKQGRTSGSPVGAYEAFKIGNTTLRQLAALGVVPSRDYGSEKSMKPDGLVVDRRGATPNVVLLVEHKDLGELATEAKRKGIFDKIAGLYCPLLACPFAAVTDGKSTYWLSVDLAAKTWLPIRREDGFNLDDAVDLVSQPGRDDLARTIERLATQLDPSSGQLVPPTSVNPTTLADNTWQSLWLASGADPDVCLRTFVEILLFKFLSDLGVLTTSPSGVKVDFATVIGVDDDKAVPYYFDHVRPTIKAIFPAGADGTSVINGNVLQRDNKDHGPLFKSILADFAKFGSLRHLDPEFKSRVFERFLKKTIGQKNWGQYFTPRNVIKAMVEMSGVENLAPGSTVIDPASGVGGFLLEPLVHRRRWDFRRKGVMPLRYLGWDRDEKTIIMAKANMLVHLSEMLEADPSQASATLAPILNASFDWTGQTTLGSLSRTPHEEFDLVLSNPPYVVDGTSKQKKVIEASEHLRSYYDTPSTGIEGLFIQLIVKGLKPGARAFVIIPDGILFRHGDERLREWVLEQCHLEGIISLPKDCFYSTPKKTYILVIRKKITPEERQAAPVFTYLVSAVGETLDARRFVIADNDLVPMASAFKSFAGNPEVFSSTDPRCKTFPIADFKPTQHWLIDRWWSEEELLALGEKTEVTVATPDVMADRLAELRQAIEAVEADLLAQPSIPATSQTTSVSLGDESVFRLSAGTRVTKAELHGKDDGTVPLFSSNVIKPFGLVTASRIKDFSRPSVLWGIDGDFTVATMPAGTVFDITDHTGRIEILRDDIDAGFIEATLALMSVGFDRTFRPSKGRMRELDLNIPTLPDGSFDLATQQVHAARYAAVVTATRSIPVLCAAAVDVVPGAVEG